MKLPRPHVPFGVKLQVAERQMRQRGYDTATLLMAMGMPWEEILNRFLSALFATAPCHLDHDPPLMLREFNPKTGKYKPDANDPDYLIWRTADEHRIKTYVRGDGAQLSDAGKRRKEIKRRKKATRPKRKWPSRPMRRPP